MVFWLAFPIGLIIGVFLGLALGSKFLGTAIGLVAGILFFSLFGVVPMIDHYLHIEERVSVEQVGNNMVETRIIYKSNPWLMPFEMEDDRVTIVTPMEEK